MPTSESKKEKIRILTELMESCLLKDILAFERIKNSELLFKLQKILVFQVGNLVSLNEIAGIEYQYENWQQIYADLPEEYNEELHAYEFKGTFNNYFASRFSTFFIDEVV